ncbi:MAG: peptidylprolyl isomerase [Candidatus Marinimicrobia bacterium]|nr:peptidylprolyl isomerase [Candidatus Neomarinimicrobiota bacterium]
MNDLSQKILLTTLLLALSLTSCNRADLPGNVIAEVGHQQITLDDFKRAYLPVLLYTDKRDSPETRDEILNFLVNQTILAQAARSLKLDTVFTLQVVQRTAQKTAFTRILYKEWVKKIIPVPTEAELRAAFQKNHHSRLVRHLFFMGQQEANQAYRLLAQGASWDSLAAQTFSDPSLAANGGLLGWMKFGDMDPDFEKAVYELKLLEISKPIQTSFGWHIIRVDEQSQELMLTEYDFSLERQKLNRMIKERHESHLADSVVNAMMNKADLIFHPIIAPKVWTVMRDQVQRLFNADEMVKITRADLHQFEGDLKPLLNEELLRFAGTSWTVKDFLQKLPEMNRQLMLTDLKSATAFLVRDEIIYTEGIKRNLAESAEVKQEVQDRVNQFLANLYLRYKAENQPISHATVQDYYRQNSSTRYQDLDSLHIFELLFIDQKAAEQFKSSLDTDLTIPELLETASASPEFELHDLGWFQGAGYPGPDYYHRLVNRPIHTVVGPLAGNRGSVLILADQRRRHAKPLKEIYEQVHLDAQDDRLSKLRLNEVQRLRTGVKISVNLAKLHAFDWPN